MSSPLTIIVLFFAYVMYLKSPSTHALGVAGHIKFHAKNQIQRGTEWIFRSRSLTVAQSMETLSSLNLMSRALGHTGSLRPASRMEPLPPHKTRTARCAPRLSHCCHALTLVHPRTHRAGPRPRRRPAHYSAAHHLPSPACPRARGLQGNRTKAQARARASQAVTPPLMLVII